MVEITKDGQSTSRDQLIHTTTPLGQYLKEIRRLADTSDKPQQVIDTAVASIKEVTKKIR